MVTVRYDDLMAAVRQRNHEARAARCTEIADRVVKRPMISHVNGDPTPAQSKWQAAWDAACIALGGDPAEYRG